VSGISEAEITDTEMFKPAAGQRAGIGRSRTSDNESTGTVEAEDKEMASKLLFATGVQPKFEKFPPDKIKLVEGASVRLDCVISGKPPPLVMWSRRGMTLKNGYRFKIVEDKENGKFIQKSSLPNLYRNFNFIQKNLIEHFNILAFRVFSTGSLICYLVSFCY